jgi:para-nitrobenzyl esterase
MIRRLLATAALVATACSAGKVGFLWNGTEVQTFAYSGSQDETEATALTDNGLIAGNVGTSGFIKNGSTYTLFNIPGSSLLTYGVNESGTVVGSYLGPEIGWGPVGVYAFTRSGSQIRSYQAPNTKGAVADTEFKSINNRGQIAGFYELFDPNPVLWTSFVLTGSSLTEIAYPGASETFVQGINDSGDVVGFYTDADLNEHAFLKAGTTYRNIDPSGPNGSSAAISISDSGLVLGFAKSNLFVYDLSTGKYLDESILLSELSNTFTFFNVTAINSSGEVVGDGFLPAPEPGSFGLLCLGGMMVVRCVSKVRQRRNGSRRRREALRLEADRAKRTRFLVRPNDGTSTRFSQTPWQLMRSAFLVVAFAGTGVLRAAIAQPVQVEGGAIAGVAGQDPSILAFKGIPFAAPPVGDLRWREPKPAGSWHAVRSAGEFGSSCVQTIHNSFGPWTSEFMTHNQVSEDCLYLNVWTGAKSASEKRPVFVYVYGGGFNSGSGAVPLYDGEGLAKKGLVVVTFNYRVGLFGFLALPELTRESPHKASGNYGLLDQVAALRWVHKNISQFGGDPERVTVGGQSAGAISVHDLTASPLAKGLFHGAIMQSGGSAIGHMGITIVPKTRAEAEADGEKFMRAQGAATLVELRAIRWQTLAKIEPGLRFVPIVDGYVLAAPVPKILSEGRQNDVVSLTGINTGELQGLAGPQDTPTTVEAYQQQAKKRFGDRADEFLKLYPAASESQIKSALRESARDGNVAALYLWAQVRARTSKTPVYEYLWNHALPGPDAARYGAFHSSELPYVFNTLNMSDRPFTAQDHEIAEVMSSYWANFVTRGDPNGKGVAHWAAAGNQPEVMELGDDFKPVPAAGSQVKFDFWKSFLLTGSE